MKPAEVAAVKDAAIKLAREQRAREEALIREQVETDISVFLEENEYETLTDADKKRMIDERLHKFQNTKSMSRLKEEEDEGECSVLCL